MAKNNVLKLESAGKRKCEHYYACEHFTYGIQRNCDVKLRISVYYIF